MGLQPTLAPYPSSGSDMSAPPRTPNTTSQRGCTCRLLCDRIRDQRGHGFILSIRGCNTDELERAAEDLEKATSELLKRAEELAKRSEELNRQMLRLAEALARPTVIKPREAPPKLVKPADHQGDCQPPDSSGILAEVKEFLDGPQGGSGLAWQDPRD
jgi:hypothetical protein